MEKPVKPTVPRPRGRPRDPAVRTAILRAARELLADGGPAAVTMEAVAARAGVGKPTVYRWWPDRHAVAMAALMEGRAPPRGPALSRSPLKALRKQLESMVSTFASPAGRNVASLIAAAADETELSKAFRNHFVLARREEGRQWLEHAKRSGEVRSNCDVEAALDAIYGALFLRLLLGHAPLDARFVARLLDVAVHGVRGGQ
jgi:AcrR family transcriptional regulator